VTLWQRSCSFLYIGLLVFAADDMHLGAAAIRQEVVMGGRRLFVPVALAVTFLLPITAAAQRRGHHERSAPRGNVVVRDVNGDPVPTQPVAVREVQVREVRVAPPVVTPARRAVERPTFDGARSVARPIIRRPSAPFPRPVDRGVRGHRPFYVFRPRVSVGFGLFVGYPVAYP
jgi:hypothetical protein